MNQEDQERVDRALDLLGNKKVDVDPEALKARIPEIMKKANERADEILRAEDQARTRHRTRNLLTLLVLVLVTGGAVLAAHFLNQTTEKEKAEQRERDDVQTLLQKLDRPNPALSPEDKALAAELSRQARERLERGDDIASIHSQLESGMNRLKNR